jgi:hypothetical protein
VINYHPYKSRDDHDIKLVIRQIDKMADRSLCGVAVLLLVVGFSDKDLVIGLDNGLALTPPSKFYLNVEFVI